MKLLLVFLISSIFLLSAEPSLAKESIFGDDLYFVPSPTLLYPTSENINLPSDGSLEFRWERQSFAQTDYYLLKIYKGYSTTSSSLIIKKEVKDSDYPFNLPIAQLEDDQVYTWVLQQVFISGKKSDKASASFRLTKQK